LTKDGIPIILHGGDNGELNHHFPLDNTEYIFDHTYETLLTYDVGEGEKIPTLEELISFVDKRLYINIEVKAPH
jgi:glycerophosphoryl diester phosphodiesterase